MRLQLVVVVVAGLAVLPALSHAQEQEPGSGTATSRLLVYSDDDATTVVSSTVDAEAALPGRVNLGVHALVDVVSSASADVISAATGRWTENRVEVGGRVNALVSDTRLGLSYVRSQENDWRSNSVAISSSKELFQRNTIVSASYGYTRNNVGRANDPSFDTLLSVHMTNIGASQLLDSKTRIGGAYTLQYLSGYMASPYRFVPTADGSRPPERHPETRLRHALSSYLVRSLTSFASARVSYRFYTDDWGVHSHTAALRLTFDPTRWLSAGIEGRVYQQNQANFYQQSYATMFRFMSNDRELSSFWDAGGAATAAAHLGPVIVDARAGVIYYKFKNFSPLRNRMALVVSGGAKLTW